MFLVVVLNKQLILVPMTSSDVNKNSSSFMAKLNPLLNLIHFFFQEETMYFFFFLLLNDPAFKCISTLLHKKTCFEKNEETCPDLCFKF